MSRVEPWSRKIPRASGQLSLSAAATASVRPKAPAMRCPHTATREYTLVTATRENLLTATETQCSQIRASPVALVVKNPPANARDIRDMSSIPGLGRSPGGEHGNPLQYSCLKNPMDRGASWATVHRITQSQTQLKQLSTAQHKAK